MERVKKCETHNPFFVSCSIGAAGKPEHSNIILSSSSSSIVKGEHGKQRLVELHKVVSQEFHGVKNTAT
jgi:hypothetical protein